MSCRKPLILPQKKNFTFEKLELRILIYIPSSGSVCLDVINQTWSPMYDMINIFEVFLPQLLRYPNPTDPLNGEAAALLMREPKSYEAKVKGGFLFLPFHTCIRLKSCLNYCYFRVSTIISGLEVSRN